MTSYKRHIKIHEGNYEKPDTEAKQVTCEVCSRVLSCQRSLKRHLATHGIIVEKRNFTKEDLTCPTCARVLSCPKNLRRHMIVHEANKVHGAPTCKICGEEFQEDTEVEQHVSTAHARELIPADAESDEGFACDICDLRLTSHEGVAKHVELYHDRRKRTEELERDKAKLFCKFCFKLQPSQDILEEHTEKEHAAERDRTQCEICLIFLHKDLVEDHMGGHIGITGYQCSICGQEFTERNVLLSHVIDKHNIDLATATCEICGETVR